MKCTNGAGIKRIQAYEQCYACYSDQNFHLAAKQVFKSLEIIKSSINEE